MKFQSSALQLSAESSSLHVRARETRVLAWVGDTPPRVGDRAPDLVTISREALERSRRAAVESAADPAAEAPAVSGEEEIDAGASDPRTELMRLLFEAITGHAIRAAKIRVDRSGGDDARRLAAAARAPEASGDGRAGWGVEITTTEKQIDAQAVSFRATGVVRTDDGREIAVAADLEMRDERISVVTSTVRAGDSRLKDPLVLNFAGGPAALAGTVDFDLDSDGSAERVDFLASGSGLLTLGANGAARPEDGSALFGVRTGDGYAELAALDEDHNGWIDEGDSAFARLGVWSRAASGAEQVRSLADLGVGAISLGSAATPMDVHTEDGRLGARVRATGIYLDESGAVHTTQQVDLASREIEPDEAAAPRPHLDVVA